MHFIATVTLLAFMGWQCHLNYHYRNAQKVIRLFRTMHLFNDAADGQESQFTPHLALTAQYFLMLRYLLIHRQPPKCLKQQLCRPLYSTATPFRYHFSVIAAYRDKYMYALFCLAIRQEFTRLRLLRRNAYISARLFTAYATRHDFHAAARYVA